jgi:competence protein ComEC
MANVTTQRKQGRMPLIWLRDRFLAERDRWVLWLPVALALGIGTYFGLPLEPPVAVGFVALVTTLVLLVVFRAHWLMRVGFLRLLAFSLGFVVAQWRAHDVAQNVLNRALPFVTMAGEVESVEPARHGARVVLSVHEMTRLAADEMPARVRIRLHASDTVIRPGDVIRVRARLAPPPSASYPGGYDFSRSAWFAGLGAVGFAFGPAERLTQSRQDGVRGQLMKRIEALRTRIAHRMTERIEGPAGGVAAALATGLRGDIPEEVRQHMRDSGLAHLLAISGLHIGLVAGFVFTLIRGGLAIVPGLALGWPLKKIAAIAALMAAAVYMLLAGATVPTQRAFVMTAIVLVAMLLNRTGISLRLIAVAASLVLLLRPEALLSVSFQMSFAAAMALVAAYEVFAGRLRVANGESRRIRRFVLYFVAVAFTTIIASLATAPFAIFHFNRLSVLGLVANLAAVPIAALWVMPLEVLALLLMPFGLDGLVLPLLGWGVEAILAVAAHVSAWPLAAVTQPGPDTAGLIVLTAGGLWLILWRGVWRLGGIVAILAGLASAGQVTPPDILIADNARLMAFRSGPDVLHLSSTRSQALVRDIWVRRIGSDAGLAFPRPGEGSAVLRCDAQSCIGQLGAHRIAFVRDPLAFEEDCRTADVLIADIRVPRFCNQPRVVIDWFDLWRGGAHAVWLDGSGRGHSRVWRARSENPPRPWMRAATR